MNKRQETQQNSYFLFLVEERTGAVVSVRAVFALPRADEAAVTGAAGSGTVAGSSVVAAPLATAVSEVGAVVAGKMPVVACFLAVRGGFAPLPGTVVIAGTLITSLLGFCCWVSESESLEVSSSSETPKTVLYR